METMKIVVKESSIIRPSQETPIESRYLSNLDLLFGTKHVIPSVYLYKANGSSIFFDTKVLKEALSRVIVAFYPIAGRLGHDENGRVELKCNGEGVLFREAEADCDMAELGHFISVEKIKQLVPEVDYSSSISSYPLFVAQVTRFKCGGVCLGMQILHIMADATAALHFINSWADMARGVQIAVPPLLDRTILRCRNPPCPTFSHIEYAPPPTLQTEADNQNKTNSQARFDLTLDQLNSLKAKAQRTDIKTKYSTYEVLVAHIWRCVCKARNLPDDQQTKLFIPVDGRSRLRPVIPPGYFGNVIFHATPIASCGEILSEPFSQTVDRLHKEIRRRDDEYLRSILDHLELLDDQTLQMNWPENLHIPNLKINSWTRIPFESADFGWGGPSSIRASQPVAGKGQILASSAENGGLSLILCLEEDSMNSFRKLFYEI